MLWIFILNLELCSSHVYYVMDATLDFIIKTESKYISRSTTLSGMLIKITLDNKILMYVPLWYKYIHI